MRPYPRYLVLEYGIDHPGEMEFMLSIVAPDIAVITELTPSHLEQFGTFERYRDAKLLLADLPVYVILHDSLRQYIDREVTYFGLGAMSDIDTSHIEVTPSGTRGRIHSLKQDFDVELHAYGAYQIQNILPLYEIARILDIDPIGITEYARTFTPEVGRSRILE
jgi:UDP-N-acetylmuramoyl-tripeptide--D-alanyl-D-alanine ligase